ncbi:unnamed protein product, partial [Oppiella nova]
NNGRGCLGLGYGVSYKTPQVIPQLCDKNIQEFINGWDFVLAINHMNHVFSWGHNDRGQCARDVIRLKSEMRIQDVYLKPQNISDLNDNNITHHSLALTTDGQVYGWGNNYRGQIGRDDSFENHYKKTFAELSAIGSGGFGTIYAVKRVEFQIRSEYVVQYYNSWSESKHLYIQMEFCSQNLRNILEVKPQIFGRKTGEAMNCVEDLKPENILIAKNVRNGRFIKLCDFGLAVEHQKWK